MISNSNQFHLPSYSWFRHAIFEFFCTCCISIHPSILIETDLFSLLVNRLLIELIETNPDAKSKKNGWSLSFIYIYIYIYISPGIIAFIAISFAITRQWSSMWRSTMIVNPSWFACVITKADFLNDWGGIDLFSDNRSVVLILSIYGSIGLIVP